MQPYEVFGFYTKVIKQYNLAKVSICKRYNIGQTAFDIVLFLHNHPQDNTARDVCEKRGIKSGIVSVELEKLVRDGYVIRETDRLDRRIQRLYLTDKTALVTRDGLRFQQNFHRYLHQELTEQEQEIYHRAVTLISEKVLKLEREDIDFA